MTDNSASPAETEKTLARPLLFLMSASTGVAVASIYYNQPLLGLIRDSFGDGAALIVPAMTQIGYAAGLFLLVPLGDKFERRGLVTIQFLALTLTLLAVAAAPSIAVLAAASLALGAFATVAQQIIPLATLLTSPSQRGKTLGLMMSGLVSGIILSRAVAGFVGSYIGWRYTFLAAVPVDLIAAGALWVSLPSTKSKGSLTYKQLVGSLPEIWKSTPPLRRAAITQAALFGSFSIFWSVLALRLEALGFGTSVAGVFGLVGALGIFVSPIAGRMADKHGTTVTVRIGISLVLASWILFLAIPNLYGMLIGVVLLDMGVQISLVSNQHTIFGLGEATRARMNTILMGLTFVGGAVGSAIAGVVWQSGGWFAVCGAGLVFALAAVAASALTARRVTSAA
jgi:predicted MFS family arabinose efflux permease